MKNDKTCHLDDEGNYYAALDYDYPSIEELYHELIKYKVFNPHVFINISD